MINTAYEHIVETAEGDAFVEGTRISVAQLIRTLEFGKKTSEQDIGSLVALYPSGNLTPAKIHSALAYFFDNKGKVLSYIRNDPPEGFIKDQYGNFVLRQ